MDEKSEYNDLSVLALRLNEVKFMTDRILKHHEKFEALFNKMDHKIDTACSAISEERYARMEADSKIEDGVNKRVNRMYAALVVFLSSSLVGVVSWAVIRKF